MSMTQETTGYRSALRTDPVVPWSLDRSGIPWSAEEDAILREMWANPAVTRDTIARALSRSTPSVAIRAGIKQLGKRPRPPLTIDEERRRRKRECDLPDESTAPAFVRMLPEYDGVVMTPRLEMAWHTILSGASLKAVMAATPGLTSVEVAALRRWSAKP